MGPPPAILRPSATPLMEVTVSKLSLCVCVCAALLHKYLSRSIVHSCINTCHVPAHVHKKTHEPQLPLFSAWRTVLCTQCHLVPPVQSGYSSTQSALALGRRKHPRQQGTPPFGQGTPPYVNACTRDRLRPQQPPSSLHPPPGPWP